ncbi:unnamed protein product [Rangifer tarandus platyrhynchus]|uniref:Uncharacterized protein n=2 Tax=Rangifer tarandus platyrhynchus TaxID=3082113 RepID=A0AC59ZPR0_RANTA|nr:unnamed protein product [Rangifer tarandus platyrhynchus]
MKGMISVSLDSCIFSYRSGSLVTKLCPTLVTLCTIASQVPLSMGFPRQAYWNGLPFPSPGDLLNPGTEPKSPAWQVDALPLSHLGSPPKQKSAKSLNLG